MSHFTVSLILCRAKSQDSVHESQYYHEEKGEPKQRGVEPASFRLPTAERLNHQAKPAHLCKYRTVLMIIPVGFSLVNHNLRRHSGCSTNRNCVFRVDQIRLDNFLVRPIAIHGKFGLLSPEKASSHSTALSNGFFSVCSVSLPLYHRLWCLLFYDR